MSTKLKVGISQRVDRISSHAESRDCLDQRLIDWVTASDLLAVPIPNGLVNFSLAESLPLTLDCWLDEINIDAVLLSGGNDVGEVKFRDDTERHLLLWASKHRKPVLGICRGMQMMAVCAGGSLVEVENHVRQRHQLIPKNDNCGPLPRSVNSFHNYALEKCPEGYEILAESGDSCIEAIKHEKYYWEGWMWHPEREVPYNPVDRIRLQKIVNNGRR